METISLSAMTPPATPPNSDIHCNDARILTTLTPEPLSRTDIIKITGLPRSTVHSCVRRLLAQHDIEEFTLASSTGGRRAALLRISPMQGVADVVELGSHHARVGITNLTGKILATQDIPLDISSGPEHVVTTLYNEWAKLHRDNPDVPAANTVAVAVPGPVNSQGNIVGAARMPGWNQIDLAALLQEATGLLTIIENDARAAAVGEWSLRGETAESAIYVKAGSGIGASWIADGIVFRGHQGYAGELTHTRVQTSQPERCSCGNTGCLETVASGAALLRQLSAVGSPITTVAEIIEAAQNGDYTVAPLMRSSGAYIGEALSSLVNFLNPQRIIIGGSLSQSRTLLAGIRSELYQRCLPMSTANLTVDTALSGKDAPLIGLAILARHTQTNPSHYQR